MTGSVRLQVPLTGGPMMLEFNEGATEVFADRSDVSAARSLSVAEIIARHQEQQRAQDFCGPELFGRCAHGAALQADHG